MTEGMTTIEIVIAIGQIIASICVMGACSYALWEINRKAGAIVGVISFGITTGLLGSMAIQAFS